MAQSRRSNYKQLVAKAQQLHLIEKAVSHDARMRATLGSEGYTYEPQDEEQRNWLLTNEAQKSVTNLVTDCADEDLCFKERVAILIEKGKERARLNWAMEHIMHLKDKDSSDSDQTDEEMEKIKPSESGPLKVLHGQVMDRMHDEM